MSVVVSGGSMGGLFTGLALLSAGHDVDVYERAEGGLRSRGAGIVAQPEILDFVASHGIGRPADLTTTTSRRQYLARDGTVERERPERMTFTGWDALYRRLRGALPDERYHAGRRTVGVEGSVGDGDGGRDDLSDAAALRFEDGSSAEGDLAVVAEGGRSATREALLPNVDPEPAGYVAWRGVISEDAVPTRVRDAFTDTFVFYEGDGELVLGYRIPGPDGGTEPGGGRLNWVWYDDVGDAADRRRLMTDADGERNEFSVSPGRLRDGVREDLLAAATSRLPDTFTDLVAATDDAFVQTVYDLSVPRMRFGRVCLLGDAAFVARPHTAAGTAKAAADGTRLARALDGACGVDDALADWAGARLDAGRRLVAEGVRMGDGYME
ncbi:FAD-dependent monooxygenase [Halobium salinum]|uniref:FAD-dependent monooxygenase n=1 Tax=Halobium salinum TaxID=1364940 RepID=A0ABD5PH57_9EURY